MRTWKTMLYPHYSQTTRSPAFMVNLPSKTPHSCKKGPCVEELISTPMLMQNYCARISCWLWLSAWEVRPFCKMYIDRYIPGTPRFNWLQRCWKRPLQWQFYRILGVRPFTCVSNPTFMQMWMGLWIVTVSWELHTSPVRSTSYIFANLRSLNALSLLFPILPWNLSRIWDMMSLNLFLHQILTTASADGSSKDMIESSTISNHRSLVDSLFSLVWSWRIIFPIWLAMTLFINWPLLG